MYIRGKQKYITTLCLIGLIFNQGMLLAAPLVAPKQCGPINFAELRDKIMSAQGGMVEQENSQEQEDKPKFDIMPLDDQEKRKIAYGIFERAMSPNTVLANDYYQQSLFDAVRLVIDDLELFGAQDNAQSTFSHINMTHTILGEAQLAHMLATPTADITTLHNRQALLKELIDNEQLFNELDGLIRKLKKAESALYSFWLEDNKATQDLINALYPAADKGGFLTRHVLSKFNKNAAVLETYTRLGNLGTAYSCVGDFAICAGLIYGLHKMSVMALKNTHEKSQEIAQMFGKEIAPFQEPKLELVNSMKKYGRMLYWPADEIKNLIALRDPNLKTLTLGNEVIDIPDKDFALGLKIGSWILLAGKTGFVTYKGYTIKGAIKSAVLTKNTANLLQSRLIGAATFINSVKKVQTIAQSNSALQQGLASYNSIKPLLKGSLAQAAEFKELIKVLQTDTFKGKASFFSYTGRVLATYKLMQAHKDNIAQAMTILGELDAYLSLAKLYKKYAHERVGFCFVEYRESNKPYLKLDGFWNPQVDPRVVVTNSVEFDAEHGMRAMVLTGSNTGGKSTLLKAMTLDVLMAQTVGIAPAQRMIITPFAYFGSSMNIVDNTAQGKSLYQAEVDRAAGLINTAHKAQERGGKIFIVMDELFRGTSPEKADKETYDCAKHLYALDNSLFVLATHYFNYPPRLEVETNGICRNYKVDAYIDAQGNIVRTFTLEPGISTNNIANNILDAALNKTAHA